MPSLMRASSSAAGPHTSPPSAAASAFGVAAAQLSAVSAFRSRIMGPSPASSVADTEEELEPPTPTPPHAHACDSCSELETEFAAAVLFVETYSGPHRILTQENSSPKKDFYAFFQQATAGPCVSPAPPPGASKTDVSKWEKWRALGQMTRHEAMKRYTTALDNLVDDWRRSANVRAPALYRSSSGSSSAAGDAGAGSGSAVLAVAGRQAPRRSTSMFERLPRIYDELGELQDRVEDETKKRDELEAHLLNFTREYRGMITREMEQVDEMRGHLTALVKTLEDDVASHRNELQAVAARQQAMRAFVENSVLLALELRVRSVVAVVRGWVRNKTLRRVLLVAFAFRVWNFLRARRLPQLAAQLLIRGLAAVSSLDAPAGASAGLSTPPRALLRS
ncbi:hypothetical protein PybrP1_006314 [[Pythium] brassicae (nom. inval.)]|nr:hypothetical protein PybrP1_006314 [[Pythium] brassicae (nom. inval.)]